MVTVSCCLIGAQYLHILVAYTNASLYLEKVQLIYIVQYYILYNFYPHAFTIKKPMAKYYDSTVLFPWTLFSVRPKECGLLWDSCKCIAVVILNSWRWLNSALNRTQLEDEMVQHFSLKLIGFSFGAHSTDVLCDWTASSRTPAAKILSVTLTQGMKYFSNSFCHN